MTSERKIGVYGMFFPPIEMCVEYARQCEAMGLDVVTFTDQIQNNLPQSIWPEIPASAYLPRAHNFYDASLVMALAAQSTSTIELFFGAVDVVREVPSKLAQKFLTLDHISHGRGIYAVGASEAKNVVQYGHSRKGSAKKLEETLQILRLIFDSEGRPVHFDGEYYSMKGGVVDLAPYGNSPPKVLVATGGSPQTLRMVGRYADGLLTNLPGMCLGGPEQFAKDVALVREGAEQAGRDPDELRFAASVLVLMNDDPAEIDRLAASAYLRWDTIVYGAVSGADWRRFGFEHPLGDEWSYARHMKPESYSAEYVREAISRVPMEASRDMGHMSGSAEKVASELNAYFDAGLNYACVIDHSTAADLSTGETAAANLTKLVSIVKEQNSVDAAAGPQLGYLGIGGEFK
ncbi:LLM class flavin-dependent oxidoreductase [Mycobacterium seoulense]|uniref:LLM class flavin-dependent oxidoreductase n=1 Tax=Mycobacterium seoulense TaxID=386911 RepID=UPI003CF55778